MPIPLAKNLSICILAITLSGCAGLERISETLQLYIPSKWKSTDDSEPVNYGWLSNFDDPILNKHVRTALQNNYDLEASAQRLEAAMASARAVNANLYPEVNAGIAADRAKSFVIDQDGFARSRYETNYSGRLEVSWEIDVWGKLNDRSRAAWFDAEVQRAAYQAARLSLAANVAKAWFDVIEAASQVNLSQQQLNSLSEALDIVENNYRAGLNGAVDVFSSRSDLERQKALLAQTKQRFELTKRNFNTLLANYPSAELDINQAKLPDKVIPVPAGLPAELLLRRPDILAAQYNWESRGFLRDAASKDRYPSLTLTGAYGSGSDSLGQLLNSDQFFWSLIGGVSQPVFNAGRLKALEVNASALERLALAEYANTVLTAFQEVENALDAEQYLLTRYQTTKLAAELAKSAYELSLEQYQNGLIEYVTVLTTQRQYFSADADQISLYNALIQNRINLHLALGGDFFNPVQTAKQEDNQADI